MTLERVNYLKKIEIDEKKELLTTYICYVDIYITIHIYDKSSKFFWKNDLANSIFLNETNSC